MFIFTVGKTMTSTAKPALCKMSTKIKYLNDGFQPCVGLTTINIHSSGAPTRSFFNRTKLWPHS